MTDAATDLTAPALSANIQLIQPHLRTWWLSLSLEEHSTPNPSAQPSGVAKVPACWQVTGGQGGRFKEEGLSLGQGASPATPCSPGLSFLLSLHDLAFSCPLELHVLQHTCQSKLFYPGPAPDLGDPTCTP